MIYKKIVQIQYPSPPKISVPLVTSETTVITFSSINRKFSRSTKLYEEVWLIQIVMLLIKRTLQWNEIIFG